MVGKNRALSRDSAARMALLRSQVTALVMHEHIQTTYAKAKEAQRLADRLITLAKRNTVTSRQQVQGMLYVCLRLPGRALSLQMRLSLLLPELY